jgi:hypothetical protein
VDGSCSGTAIEIYYIRQFISKVGITFVRATSLHTYTYITIQDVCRSVILDLQRACQCAHALGGPDLSNPITLEELLKSYNTIGFQATGLSRAIQIVEEMVHPPCTDVGEAYM